jgi:hypothetical protein
VGWWVPLPKLAKDEKILWNVLANREQTINRQVGGRLFVTQRRLIFQPSRFDALIRGERWRANLVDICAVGLSPRRLTIPWMGRTAGNRNRLKVIQINGDVDLFVVNRLENVIERLRATLSDDSS